MTRLTTVAMAGGLIGLSLGAFFDGVLLHQILQWHHLFSGIEGSRLTFRDQVLFDGVFHAVMYVILLAGLLMLWLRRSPARDGDQAQLLRSAIGGFGVWHLLDAVVSHSWLRLHRIWPESTQPLLWDLLFAGIGVACVVVATRPVRFPKGSGVGLICVAIGIAVAASVPLRPNDTVAVVFRPDVSGTEIVQAAASLDAFIVGSDAAGGVWTLRLTDAREGWRLYQHGALFVSGTYAGLGCFTPPARHTPHSS